MRKHEFDVTKILISDSDIRQQIGSIFPDSVILDSHFRFISVSQNILEATGYTRPELQGQCISLFSVTSDLKTQLQCKLRPGYFQEEPFEIQGKSQNTICYGVSGFYLGLIADVNGMIVLKFKNLDELNLMYDRLEAKTTELDRFVYLSAHALRGPLATVKGLINLAKISTGPEDMQFLLTQMDTFSEKLDEKLHRLIYFAESDKGDETQRKEILLSEIVETLALDIREGSVDHPVGFQSLIVDPTQRIENGEIILSLLRNLVLFFCQQPKGADNSLLLDVHSTPSTSELILRAKGFQLGDSMRGKLLNINFGYSEILNHPELINFYAAKKIIFRLHGDIQFILSSSNEVVVLMTVRTNLAASGDNAKVTRG